MSHKSDFERDGFVVLPRFYSAPRIDEVLGAVDSLIANKPDRVTCDDMTTGERVLLKDAAKRLATSRLKINDLYLEMPDVRSLAINSEISPILTQLLEQTPLLCNSLYFEKGSAQPKHIDSLYMTPVTVNHLIAIWVALEDAHDDSGQLEYYPGSHKIPLMRFNDGSYHATQAEMPRWNAYMEDEIQRRGLRVQSFPAKKGDVFIWHANLLHGGGPIRDLKRTRKSFVFHYFSAHDSHPAQGDKLSEGGAKWLRRSHPVIEPAKSAPGELAEAGRTFSEGAYLARHADVAQAVKTGDFRSGRHHYELFGRIEGRVLG